MDSELKAKLGGQVRLILGFLSGWAVAHQWIDDATASRLIELAVLLVPVGLGIWSWWQKKHQTQIVEAALAAPPTTTVEEVHAIVDSQK